MERYKACPECEGYGYKKPTRAEKRKLAKLPVRKQIEKLHETARPVCPECAGGGEVPV